MGRPIVWSMKRTPFYILAWLAWLLVLPTRASASAGAEELEPAEASWSCLDAEPSATQGNPVSTVSGANDGDLSVAGPGAPRASVDRSVVGPERPGCLLEVRWEEVVAQAASETVSFGASAGADSSSGSDSDGEPPICGSDGARCTSVPVDLPPPALTWTLVKGDRSRAVDEQRPWRCESIAAPRVIGGPLVGYPQGPFEPPRGALD